MHSFVRDLDNQIMHEVRSPLTRQWMNARAKVEYAPSRTPPMRPFTPGDAVSSAILIIKIGLTILPPLVSQLEMPKKKDVLSHSYPPVHERELTLKLFSSNDKGGKLIDRPSQDCAICYQNEETDDPVHTLPCTHVVHPTCMSKWNESREGFLEKTRCGLCQLILEDATNVLDSTTIHLPPSLVDAQTSLSMSLGSESSMIPSSAFLRLGTALMMNEDDALAEQRNDVEIVCDDQPQQHEEDWGTGQDENGFAALLFMLEAASKAASGIEQEPCN